MTSQALAISSAEYDELPALLPTDRELRLRPWAADDVDAVYAACTDPRASRWVFRDYTREQAAAFVLGAPEAWRRRRHLRLCLTDDTGAVLGSGDLDDLHPWHRSTDLGWWIAPSARGRGLGVRLGRLLVRTGFEVLDLHRVTATLAGGNTASRWVAAGAGLRFESAGLDGWRDGTGQWHGREVWRLVATEKPLEPQPAITAGALHLRPWRPSDAPDVQRACSDPETARWTYAPDPYTLADAERWCTSEALGLWAGGLGAHFAVVDSVTGGLLASVGARNQGNGLWDVGWWTAPWARGRGVATNAAGALLRWLRATTDAEIVEWRAVVGNEGSRIVAERLGFTPEGTLRGRFAKQGRPREDDWIASLRLDAWAG